MNLDLSVTKGGGEQKEAIDIAFLDAVREFEPQWKVEGHLPLRQGSTLTGILCREIFEAQIVSRHLDFAARWLRARNDGFYTIGSAGHEGNAAIAAALRPTDPALLHYRSGGFYAMRARQVPGSNPIRDVLLGLCAASSEPIAGGRHKVFGNQSLAIIPQTSTIASHLPRAIGVAFSIARSRRIGVESRWAADAVTVCSFGDASSNHSTALGAFNAAGHCAYQRLPLPLLFICEDNGLGISVSTPEGWVREARGSSRHLRYFSADGCEIEQSFDVAREAVDWVRKERRPAFLHLSVVRFMGHAGTDVESAYRKPAAIARDLARDPLVATARLLIESSQMDPDEVVALYESVREQVREEALRAIVEPRLRSAQQVMEPIAPRRADLVRAEVGRQPKQENRRTVFAGRLPEAGGQLTLAQAVNGALTDLAVKYPNLVIFGEDVAVKGGVYGVTRGLRKVLGSARVFDTILDEQSILGMALGAGISGLLPIPEIQYLAYVHNAEDQIRGEAATQSFFSQGQFRNPMVVRIAGLAYQKGFGGHYHNDNAVAVFRDIPGLIVAAPSRPEDAAAMLRTCVAAAAVDGSVCVFLEPIALYHTRDLHEAGDGGWLSAYDPPDSWSSGHVPIGSARVHGSGRDLTVVTFGNGLRMSLRVARQLESHGVGCRVVDIRWLSPLPLDDIFREANATGRVLVVDETRSSGGVSEGILTALIDRDYNGPIRRVTSADSFIPLGDAAELVLLSESDISKAAKELLRRPAGCTGGLSPADPVTSH